MLTPGMGCDGLGQMCGFASETNEEQYMRTRRGAEEVNACRWPGT